jgi:TrmH family RNA methyltransferase
LINKDLKYYAKLKQKKFREENKEFLIEGVHLFEECQKSKYYKKNISKVFVRNDFKDERILGRIRHIDTEFLPAKEFNKLSETENSQGIIGVVQMTDNLPEQEGNIICAFDNLNDPGNLGTILRTCWWFGIENILIGKESVEIYNSKVIRASQGAIFNLIIKDNLNLKFDLIKFNKNGYDILLTDLSAKIPLSKMEFSKDKKYVIVFGNEANGISKDIKDIPEFGRIKIDSYSNCESLNVASSTAIILHEIRKNITE